jgi:ATP-dependent DNA helicase RecG
LTVEKIKSGNYKSHLRNKQIASIFKELDLIEKYGSGARRAIETFIAYGLPEPEYEATQGGMAVTVFKKPFNNGQDNLIKSNGGVTKLRLYIQAHPGQRASDIATGLNLPLRTIERWLKKLKEAKTIEFRGASKTGGYFSTTKVEVKVNGNK